MRWLKIGKCRHNYQNINECYRMLQSPYPCEIHISKVFYAFAPLILFSKIPMTIFRYPCHMRTHLMPKLVWESWRSKVGGTLLLRTDPSKTSCKGKFRTVRSFEYCLDTDKRIQIDSANNGALGIVYILRSNLSGIYLRQSIHI